MKYFVTRPNYWGFSPESLYKAMQKCGIMQDSKLEYFANSMDYSTSVKEALSDLAGARDDAEWEINATETDFIAALISEDWELDSVSEIDGSQRWLWKGEGESPEFDPIILKLTSHADGSITSRE